MLDDQADLAAQHVAFQLADPRQVELVDQLAVDPLLEFLEFLGSVRIGRPQAGVWWWASCLSVCVEAI